MTLPRLLVVADRPATRLRLISELRARFELISDRGAPPTVRNIRELRPDIVLLDLDPRRPARQLRLCLSIKTDRRAPRVVVLDSAGVSSPQQAMETHLADAYAYGLPKGQALAQWLPGALDGAILESKVKRRLLRRLADSVLSKKP